MAPLALFSVKPGPPQIGGVGDPSELVALLLDALDQLAPRKQLCVLIEHKPFPLYRLLSNRADAYCTRVLADALYEVAIWRCGALATSAVLCRRLKRAVTAGALPTSPFG